MIATGLHSTPGRSSRAACTWGDWRARTWAAVAELGRIAHDKYRGWHIDFRAVTWPEGEPRRIRINRTYQGGRFLDEPSAQQCLTLIRERAMNRPLFEVLSEYLAQAPAEQMVPARWVADFLPAKLLDLDPEGDRYRELAAYPRRGYLDFWNDCPVGKIDGPGVVRWYAWLRQAMPHLSDVTLRHIVTDFRTFVGYLHSVGALPAIPRFPRVRVRKRSRVVPDRTSLERVLGEIPEAERGLWLSRAYAGLRPSESRRLDVRDYRDGELTVRAEIAKTNVERVLPIALVAPELDTWIRAHRSEAKPWEPLFPARAGKRRGRAVHVKDGRWRGTSERRVWCAALEAAGLEHVAPNLGGRHAFGTAEATSGTDLLALRDFMGHTSVRTTEIYLHTSSVGLARRMRPLAQSRTTAQESERNPLNLKGK